MGMFDTVYIERKDILDNIKKLTKDDIHPDFQTKDLENCLFEYRVTNTGLEAEEFKFRKPKKSETRKIGNVTLPLMVKEHKGWKKLVYTTTLNVYTSTQKGKWVDLQLEYFRGKLMKYSIILQTKKTYKQYDFLTDND